MTMKQLVSKMIETQIGWRITYIAMTENIHQMYENIVGNFMTQKIMMHDNNIQYLST